MNCNIYLKLLLILFCTACADKHIYAQTTEVSGPIGSVAFGKSITFLPNSNYIITDPNWSNGLNANAGAVYLYDGITHELLSKLTGTNTDDFVGGGGITILPNGNFLVSSGLWDNGTIADAGAVTWCSAVTGTAGAVSASNSLIGNNGGDKVGSGGIAVLDNDHYVVSSPDWYSSRGAATWRNGAIGSSGIVSITNSLVGTVSGDKVGSGGVTGLSNNNYVVNSPLWSGSRGAVTWGEGATGVKSEVSSRNSLRGTYEGNLVGSGGITKLTNGNYVVASPTWWGRMSDIPLDIGAVTWCSGIAATTSLVGPSNSLVGSSFDKVGSGGVTALTNGNYVVSSPIWSSSKGAATWGNGATGITGNVSAGNSLVGTTQKHQVSYGGVTALNNGNYVVNSYLWDSPVVDAGAVTWGNGTTGTTGIVSGTNSLIGSEGGDQVGSRGITILPNGNYVVSSPSWDGGKVDLGAVTCGNGFLGTTGAVSAGNSLIGRQFTDQVGLGGVYVLTSGNYVISSPEFRPGGAVTWGDGAIGISGVVSATNSLVGTNSGDRVGYSITTLNNGNYVISSPFWNGGTGAVTWLSGTVPTVGAFSEINSLKGRSASDYVGFEGVTALTNGNYVVASSSWDNGSFASVGAITWGNGTTGTSGYVSATNSLVGAQTGDELGYTDIPQTPSGRNVKPLPDGNYLVYSRKVNNGPIENAGSISYGNGADGSTTGLIAPCNSVFGNIANKGASLTGAKNPLFDYVLVSKPLENKYVILRPYTDLAGDGAESTRSVSGAAPVTFSQSSCSIIARLTPAGGSPVSGLVSAKVHALAGTPFFNRQAYVRRSYDITPPSSTASAATANVTLYFYQSDFSDYNASDRATQDLPTGPADAAGKAALRITQQHGTSESGLPGSYSGKSEVINPADGDIVWNGTESRWEVSFAVTGFSGFFVHGVTLPVTTVSGRIWDDANASVTRINEKNTATDDPNQTLTVYLTDELDMVIGKANVAPDGTWQLTDVPQNGIYKVTLTTDRTISPGVIKPTFPNILPGGWVSTGINFPTSIVGFAWYGTVYVDAAPVKNVDFGIQKKPTVDNKTFTLTNEPRKGEEIVLNGKRAGMGSPGELSGLDYEDGIYDGNPFDGGPITRVIITSLPVPLSGPASGGLPELYYQGRLVTVGEIITYYFEDYLSVKLNGIGYKGFQFTYKMMDAANQESNVATYRVTWQTALPVKLITFVAGKEQNTARLSWATSEEVNADRFEIERSADARSWKSIKSVKAIGNSSSQQKYLAIDNLPLPGLSYYRLKMIDLDGSYTYSGVESLLMKNNDNLPIPFPNPVTRMLFLTGDPRLIHSVSLLRPDGQTVFERLPYSNGIDVSKMPTGEYLLIIHQTNASSITHKIVICN
jgi:hypothetical protein